jgi:pimeloyl-ACP methyl ester carboxylesterase
LFIAGGFDPVTPLEDSMVLAEAFADSTTLVFTRGGHGFLRSEPCLGGFIGQFLSQQTLPAEHTCNYLEVLH